MKAVTNKQITAILTIITAKSFLALILFLTVSLQCLALYSLCQQPWTGLQISADLASGFSKIIAIDHDSPASIETSLQIKKILTQITDGQTSVLLTAENRMEFLTAPTFAELDKLVVQHTVLWELLTAQKPLTFFTLDGQSHTLTPKPHTPLNALPPYIWGLVLVHLLVPIIGSIVWLYKSHTLETFILYIAALSYSLFGTVFIALYQREFTINPKLIIPLTTLGNTTIVLFGLALSAILTYYPKRLLNTKFLLIYLGVWLILSINYYQRWFEIPGHIFLFQFLPLYLWMLFIIYLQWQATHRNPINRVILFIFHVSIQVPIGLAILFYALPILLGHSAYISPVVAHLLVISMFAGWVLGILRYRLFAAEYWYFKILLWIFSGSLVITSDLLLIGLLKITEHYALGLAIIITGFIYLPLRQWMLGRFSPEGRLSLQDFLPTFNAAISNALSPLEFEKSWRTTLQQRFQPMQLTEIQLPHRTQNCNLGANGLHLYVPRLTDNNYYQLSGKHTGAHLFSRADCTLAESLLALARTVNEASEARQQAVLTERQRIMHDLHDTVGARLLTLTHTLPTAEHQQAVRETLHVLRQTIKFSLKQNNLCLEELLAEWRIEIVNRLEAAQISLVWQTEADNEAQTIEIQTALELTHILRELISNALKHAKPSTVVMHFKIARGYLSIELKHNGDYTAPIQWQEGTGLTSIQRRLQRVEGSMTIDHHTTPNYLTFFVTVKLMG